MRSWRIANGIMAAVAVAMLVSLLVPAPALADDATLEAPTLYAPSYGRSGDLILVWEKVVNATSYTAQVAMNSEFNSNRSASTTMGRTMFTGLLPGWYYCRVQAANGAAVSNWSEVQQTWVSAGAHLETVTISSMVGGGGNATITWNAVPSAGRYMVEICADPGFDPPLYHSDTPGTSWTFNNLSAGIYQVRVCAYNESAWSGWTTSTLLISGGASGASLVPLAVVIIAAILLVAAFFLWRRRQKS